MSRFRILDTLIAKSNSDAGRSFGWDLFQVFASVLLAVLAFLVTNIWAESLSEKAEQVAVVVATKDLSAPRIVTAGDLAIRTFRRDSLPKTAIPESNMKDVFGVTLIHPLSGGQILTTNELAGKVDPELGGFSVPKNAKGLSIPSNWLSSPFPKVKRGDTVTIAYGFSSSEKNASGIVAQGVPVLSVEKGDSGQIVSILVAIDDKLALSLVQLRASNYQLAIAVDGIAPESNLFK